MLVRCYITVGEGGAMRVFFGDVLPFEVELFLVFPIIAVAPAAVSFLSKRFMGMR